MFNNTWKEPDAEVVVKVSSQPNGNTGWEVRLRRGQKETDQEYFARTMAMHELLAEKFGAQMQEQLRRSIEAVREGR